MRRKPECLLIVIATLAALGPARSAMAHVGPPFPILVDRPIPGYMVSVWADPDVGEAVFHVVLESGEPAPTGAAPEVNVWVQPVNERLPKTTYRATLESAGDPLRFLAKPEFDAAELWTVGIDVHLAEGSHQHLVTNVEATPPGLGPWGVLIYLIPFLVFGGLWGYAFLRRARAIRNAARDAAKTPKNACR